MTLYFSKSKYCSAVQCPKMLWLNKYRSEEFDSSVMNEAVLRTGNEVGNLAMGLFGDFKEVPYGNLSDMLKITKDWLNAGTPIIAEASFSYNGLFCSVDILKNPGNGFVELYEVKSSTSASEIYYHDIAYQCYVLTKLGLHVNMACLVHINNSYVRFGPIDLDSLFTVVDVTEIVLGMSGDVESRIEFLTDYMAASEEPSDPIGPHCFNPYDCGFWNYCTRALPHPNVFDLSGTQKRTMFKFYNDGVVSFEDLEKSKGLKKPQLQQIRHELYDQDPETDSRAIEEFLSSLSYPLYFLDFETFQPAIPLFDNSRPYEQIPFQYSLHYIEVEDGKLLHREYLAEPGEDPRRGVAESLCRDIPDNVCVMAYNMGFEKGRIKRMAELYPDLAEHLMAIHDHIVDLMVPFKQRAYYCRAMQGSYSIKYVLPALFPDDPELDYHKLKGVHNGAEASDVFSRMKDMDSDEREVCRRNLLKYCELDTLAMVKIWQKLSLLY